MSGPTDDAGFDWASPRWRDEEDTQSVVERDRRLWDRQPPGQSGAIDAGASVPWQKDGPAEDSVQPPKGAEQPPARAGRWASAPSRGRPGRRRARRA